MPSSVAYERRYEKMQLRKWSVVLLALLLAAMALVPMVNAVSPDTGVVTRHLSPEEGAKITGANPDKDIGVGGLLTTRTALPSGVTSALASTAPSWSAYTDLWVPFFTASKDYTGYSRSRTSAGLAYDIDKIGIRGRVWRDGSLYYDQTQTNYNSADAQLSYEYAGLYTGGTWDARSDHTFELSGYTSWYPVTTDTLT
jgi:hypothetical protein